MHAWLDDHQLDGFGRLWQGLRVEPGWEDALEAVLRERLNGIAIDDLQRAAGWLDQPPPGKVSFFQKGEGPTSATELAGRKPLLSLISLCRSRRGHGVVRLARSRVRRARCDRRLR
jgi:chromosome segregation protein